MTKGFEGTLTRRALVQRFIGGAAAVAVAGAVAGLPSQVDAGTGYFRTTANLNLRSQASASSTILLTIPSGGVVEQVGPSQYGFTKVSYLGNVGWAKSEYLTPSGSAGEGDMPAYRGLDFTTAAVNLRKGAGTSYGVIRTIPSGASVNVYDAYENYFWLVNYQGQYGWVHADFLQQTSTSGDIPVFTGTGKTTAAVNMRSGGGSGYSVLQVLPKDTTVELYSGPAGSYQLVRYAGKFGYVHSDYIAGS